MKKFIFFLNLFLFTLGLQKINAQPQGVALNLGYTYINTNTGYVGGEYTHWLTSSDRYWHGISAGAGTYYGSFNGNFKFGPTANLTYIHTIFLSEFSISPYHINPNIGLNFFNIARLKAGYSWKLGHENINMTGITFGVNFLFGTHGFYEGDAGYSYFFNYKP